MPVPDAAHRLADASRHLTTDLGLIADQPALTGMAAAADIIDRLAHVTEQLGIQITLVTEYIRREHEAGRIVPHPGLDGLKDVDVVQHTAMLVTGTGVVVGAADVATRSLGALRNLAQELATRDNLPERIGGDPVKRSKGYALNLLHAALVGQDWKLVGDLADRTDPDEAEGLVSVLRRTADIVSDAHATDGT